MVEEELRRGSWTQTAASTNAVVGLVHSGAHTHKTRHGERGDERDEGLLGVVEADAEEGRARAERVVDREVINSGGDGCRWGRGRQARADVRK